MRRVIKSELALAAIKSGHLSKANDHWNALRRNNSDHPDSNNTSWSSVVNEAKAGTDLAHLIVAKRTLCAVSVIEDGNSTAEIGSDAEILVDNDSGERSTVDEIMLLQSLKKKFIKNSGG